MFFCLFCCCYHVIKFQCRIIISLSFRTANKTQGQWSQLCRVKEELILLPFSARMTITWLMRWLSLDKWLSSVQMSSSSLPQHFIFLWKLRLVNKTKFISNIENMLALGCVKPRKVWVPLSFKEIRWIDWGEVFLHGRPHLSKLD